jgi:hypothetical protein
MSRWLVVIADFQVPRTSNIAKAVSGSQMSKAAKEPGNGKKLFTSA